MKDSEAIALLEVIEEEQRALDARRAAVLEKLTTDQRQRVDAWLRKPSPNQNGLSPGLVKRSLEATGNNTGHRVQPDLPPVRSPFGGLGGVGA